jgi:hypothetical protein
MNEASGPRRRRIGRITAAVVGGLLLLATLLPLLVRGPVARWAVARATAGLCGKFEISGGHLGWAAVWQLLLGAPTDFAVENVRITGADGKVVFAAERFEATLEIHTKPSRLVLSDVLMARGSWRLALPDNAVGSFDAFLGVPDEGRAGCLDPHAKRTRKAARRGGPSGSLVIRNVEFEDVDVDLAFPVWELELGRVNAAGMLALGGDGPPLQFEARDVIAAAGALRIGRRGEAWTARVPFDAVAIADVGVTPAAPSDLRMEVAGAETGRARLSGHAAFRNIFPLGPNKPPPGVPGLEVDARWANFGGALTGLDASWRPEGAWAKHLDGDLRATISGPFTALAGTLQVEGGGTRLTAKVARGAADLALAFAGVETGWMLDPALRPLLGGLLHGHFHATARLWPTLAGIEAAIPDADLRLDRRRAPSGPRHFELRIGELGNGEVRNRKYGRGEGATDTLYANVTSIHLADAILRLDDLRVDWTGLKARVDARVAFAAPARGPTKTGRATPKRARSEVDARGTLAVAALEDWIPGGAVTGPLNLSARAQGTIDRVELGLAFPPPTAIGVLGQRFLLPRKLDALWTSDAGLSVPRVQLRRVGGGTIEVSGRLGEGGRIAAGLGVRDYPIGEVPGLDRDGLPGRLTGALHADLTLGGALERPTLKGQVGVTALAFDKRPVGDVETSLRLGADGGEAEATIDPGVTVHARVRRRPSLAIDASVALRDRALGPWLPPPVSGAALFASGDAKVGYHAGALSGDGTVQLAGPGLTGVALDGQVHGLDARARLTGELDVARWPQLWSRVFKSATGALDFDLTVVPAVTPKSLTSAHPHLSGNVRIGHALVLRTARWPAPITVDGGGRLALDGEALALDGFTVTTPGLRGSVAGRATLDRDDLERTRLALALQAELDAAHFPVRLPAGVSVGGRATIDAQIGGTLGAAPGPRIDGNAELDGLTVQLSPTTPVARASGLVEAHGERLRTEALRVEIAGVGSVAIGVPGKPASAELASLSPFRLGAVDVPFSGRDLKIGQPSSALYIPDLDTDLRLTGDGRSELTVSGVVAVAGGSYDSSRGSKKKAPSTASSAKPRASGPWYQALPPHLTLDLELRGANKGLSVAVPVLPDVTVDFQCHLLATSRGAKWTGRLRGDGAYARTALALADWFRDSELRKCQLTN